MGNRLLCVLGAIGVLSAQAYTYVADFNVTDGADGTPAMTPRQETIFSHRHAEVRDGTYAVLVSGNRHYLATPKLRNFRLELDLAFGCVFASLYRSSAA